MPLQENVVEAVANANFKTIGDTSSQFSNLIMNDAIMSSRNMSAIREKAIARSLERMDTVNNDEVAGNSGSLAAAVALAQQLAKVAQTTVPTTVVERPNPAQP
jgi:hypothetical protein